MQLKNTLQAANNPVTVFINFFLKGQNMPENSKRTGCGCGGCLLFCFYSIIILVAGMFLSSLVNTGWDPGAAKDKLIKDSTDIAFLVKDTATEIITGEESSSSTESPASLNSLIDEGNQSYNKAMDLLKKAREVEGAERQKILRELQSELQKSLKKYQEAEKQDKNNAELVKKITHLQDLLNKMEPQN